MKKMITILAGAVCLCGCSGSGTSSESPDMILDGDAVIVAESSPVRQRLEVQAVALSPYVARFSTSGIVKAVPSAYAEVATPFAGRIVKSYVRLGQYVGRGGALFEFVSPDYSEACRTYFDAVREAEQAERELARARDLLDNRVGSVRDAEQAQLDFELKRQARANAEAALRVFNVDPAGVRMGEPLVVRAPIAGKVVTDRIVIGQYVRDDADPLVVVADLDKVWVVANVKEKDMRLVERLQEVAISLAASPDEPVHGRICHVDDLLDEQTRSVEVIIECDNADGRMKPNMYALVELADRPVDAVVVPSAAVMQHEQNCYVFREAGDGRFVKTPVTVTATDGERSVIGSGLAAGERIVVKGAFYLSDAK